MRCGLNYPIAGARNNSFIGRQTSAPDNVDNKSLYVSLRSSLFDSQTGEYEMDAKYLAEIPLDKSWLLPALQAEGDATAAAPAGLLRIHACTQKEKTPFGEIYLTGQDPGGLMQIHLWHQEGDRLYLYYVGYTGIVRMLYSVGGQRPSCFRIHSTSQLDWRVVYGANGPSQEIYIGADYSEAYAYMLPEPQRPVPVPKMLVYEDSPPSGAHDCFSFTLGPAGSKSFDHVEHAFAPDQVYLLLLLGRGPERLPVQPRPDDGQLSFQPHLTLTAHGASPPPTAGETRLRLIRNFLEPRCRE